MLSSASTAASADTQPLQQLGVDLDAEPGRSSGTRTWPSAKSISRATRSRAIGEVETVCSISPPLGMLAAKWVDAATSTPLLKACGTTRRCRVCASQASRRPWVSPPQRARSGWIRSRPPSSISRSNAA